MVFFCYSPNVGGIRYRYQDECEYLSKLKFKISYLELEYSFEYLGVAENFFRCT